MGAWQSAANQAHESRKKTHLSATKGSGSLEGRQVIAFHSSSELKNHLDDLKKTSKLVVIDFSASWCGPCQFIEPKINDFAKKYPDVEFIKIDVDEFGDVAKEYQVQAMPTFILVKKGEKVDIVVGAKEDELKKKIEKHRS